MAIVLKKMFQLENKERREKMRTKIEVRTTEGKGRAVFASKAIRQGEEICSCQVIVIPESQSSAVRKTILDYYVFSWPGERQKEDSKKWSRFCVALGAPSLINHSANPNSFWSVSKEEATLSFFAKRNIRRGEEILHDYHWPKSMTREFKE